MVNVLVVNPVPFHYECIESVLVYLNRLLDYMCQPSQADDISVHSVTLLYMENVAFKQYMLSVLDGIQNKYKMIITINEYTPECFVEYQLLNDIIIYVTDPELYKIKDVQLVNVNPSIKTMYIVHNYSKNYVNHSPSLWLWYLAPHCGGANYFIPKVLPYSHESVSYKPRVYNKVPIFLIQGDIRRRDIRQYYAILRGINAGYIRNCKFRIIGKCITGNIQRHPMFEICPNTDFIRYHELSVGCDYILPLVSYTYNTEYYRAKLTSSISYGLGYNMKFVIDNRLSDVYNIPGDMSYVYNASRPMDIIRAIKNAVNDYYSQPQSILHGD